MLQTYLPDNQYSLKWPDWITCLSCLLMTGGMVGARSLLSVGMILLLVVSFHPRYLKYCWHRFRHSGFALASLGFFVVYLISGLWSEDKSNWLAVVQIKLPFLFFPFAMFSLPLRNYQWLKIMISGLLLFLLGGMVYGFYYLITDPFYTTVFHMPSPMESDYIRFTIVIVLSMMFVVFFLRKSKLLLLSKLSVAMLVLWLAIAVSYIHIQAAKSGLVAFVIFSVAFILDYGIRNRKIVRMLIYLALLAAGEYAFSKLPSVSMQINNFAYEQKVLETKDTAGTNRSSSFVPRVNSYKVAEEVIKANLITGVGAGDMKREMDKVYSARFPGLLLPARILPHNEFLCSFLAVGIPLTILTLVLMVLFPLFEKRNRNIYFLTTWVILFFGLMIEPMLEVQYGIFVFLFFIHLWIDVPVENPEHRSINA